MPRINPLSANLDALAARGCTVPSGSAGRLRIEGDAPAQRAWILGDGGGWSLLHSGRDPHAEAERWLGAAAAPEASLVFVSVGLGYALDVLERIAPSARVLVVEPFPEIARALLARRDWSNWIASGKLTLLVGPDYQGSSGAWRLFGETGPSGDVLVHPVLAHQRPGEVAAARVCADRVVFDWRANAEAKRQNAGRYLTNTLRNLRVVADSGDAQRLEGRFAGVPGVLVAAGPSLDDHLSGIADARGKAVIVAVDTAARPLVTAGIHPHLVVGLDPTDANARHLAALPQLPESWLVAEASLGPSAFAPFEGRTFLFSLGFHPWPWLGTLGIARGSLRVWGSVATAAFDLMVRLGCDPIVCVGLDLAFVDDRPYCRGTIFEEEWADRTGWGDSLPDIWTDSIRRWQLVAEPNAKGAPVQTAPHLLAFRSWLVDRTKEIPDRHFVTVGNGVLHGGRFRSARSVGEELAGHPALPDSSVVATLRDTCRTDAGRDGLIRAVDALIANGPEATAPDDPLAAWLTFAGPDTGHTAVRAALEHAAGTFRSGPPASTPSADEPGLPLAEHAQVIRSALRGVPASFDDTTPMLLNPWRDRSDEEILRTANGHLAYLASYAGHLTEQIKPRVHRGIDRADRAPVSSLFTTARQVLAFQGETAELLRRWSRSDTPLPEHRFWSGAIDHIYPADAALGTSERKFEDVASPDRLARFLLLRQWACCVLWHDNTASGQRIRQVLRAAFPIGLSASLHTPDPVRCTISWSETSRVAADAIIDARSLGRVMTGGLVGYRRPGETRSQEHRRSLLLTDDGERDSHRRPAWLADAIAPATVEIAAASEAGGSEHLRRVLTITRWVTPEFGTDAGLPPSMVVSSIDDGHALLSGYDGSESVVVDGRLERIERPGWPRPILGEQPQGAHGGSIGWHNVSPGYLMLRKSPQADVHIVELPFRPNRLLPLADGSWLAVAADNGLWTWSSARGATRVADAPPSLSLREVTGGYRIDPLGRDEDGMTRRTRFDHALLWRPGSSVLERLPLDEDGPCWQSSANGGWTADAYPQSDVVRFTDDRGGCVAMICYYPVGVAWAGETLIVISSTSREILCFRNLLSVLNQIRKDETGA